MDVGEVDVICDRPYHVSWKHGDLELNGEVNVDEFDIVSHGYSSYNWLI